MGSLPNVVFGVNIVTLHCENLKKLWLWSGSCVSRDQGVPCRANKKFISI